MIKRRLKEQAGFTLIEMLIVVILLGILAMLIIPQISVSTGDANLNTLKSNLASMRNAIELYYHQHNSTYPGEIDNVTGNPVANAAAAQTSFLAQLTLYSAITGVTQNTKDATYKYGPYIKKGVLPMNPYNDLNTILCDIVEVDITVAASSGSAGWKFYTLTGRLIANDGAHDSN